MKMIKVLKYVNGVGFLFGKENVDDDKANKLHCIGYPTSFLARTRLRDCYGDGINDFEKETALMAHRYMYYVLGAPMLSDSQYDTYEREMVEDCGDKWSPLKEVGSSMEISYTHKVVDMSVELMKSGVCSCCPLPAGMGGLCTGCEKAYENGREERIRV